MSPAAATPGGVPTSRLRRLQEDFHGYLLHPDGRMRDDIVGTRTVSADARLRVYAEAYRLRLLEALRVDYPVLHTLYGDEDFERLGLAYIERHPSRHFSIRYFGRHLSRALGEDARFRDSSFLAELAAFEWALGEAFDAADSPVATLGEISAIAPEAWPDMCLRLHLSLRRLDLRWNVPPVWKAVSEGESPLPWQCAEVPLTWAIWRKGLETYFRSLTPEEAWMLGAVLQGQCFADLCEGLCAWVDEAQVALHAAGLLRTWVTDGWVVAADYDDNRRSPDVPDTGWNA
jgi:hypothetical protein